MKLLKDQPMIKTQIKKEHNTPCIRINGLPQKGKKIGQGTSSDGGGTGIVVDDISNATYNGSDGIILG